MRTLFELAGIAAITLAGSTAQATDFSPLMDVAHSTWPAKSHIGVVADYSRSRAEILALAQAAGEGNTITVVDTKGFGQLEKAGNLMMYRVRPDFLVMLPADPLVWDGSPYASHLIHQVAVAGIPTIATTPAAIRQGAVFSISESTGLDLLVTERLMGTVEVILPQKGRYVNNVSGVGSGMATVSVVGGF